MGRLTSDFSRADPIDIRLTPRNVAAAVIGAAVYIFGLLVIWNAA